MRDAAKVTASRGKIDHESLRYVREMRHGQRGTSHAWMLLRCGGGRTIWPEASRALMRPLSGIRYPHPERGGVHALPGELMRSCSSSRHGRGAWPRWTTLLIEFPMARPRTSGGMYFEFFACMDSGRRPEAIGVEISKYIPLGTREPDVRPLLIITFTLAATLFRRMTLPIDHLASRMEGGEGYV